jgi:hypothetical protein
MGRKDSSGRLSRRFRASPTNTRCLEAAGRSHVMRLSIREDENPITGNTSRFLPQATV